MPAAVSAMPPFHTVPYQPISTVDITAQLSQLSTRQLRLLYEICMMLLMYSVGMPESKLQMGDPIPDHSDQDKSLSDLSMSLLPKTEADSVPILIQLAGLGLTDACAVLGENYFRTKEPGLAAIWFA